MRRALPLGLGICLMVGVAFAAPQSLSIPEARELAAKSILTGQPQVAVQIAQGLLERDPNDVSALVTLSRAQRLLGDHQAATTSARHAWSVATTDREKFFSAQATAQALSSAGHRTRAQLWLRRAAHVAPSERLKARAVRDFRYVKGRNPWQTHLSFGLSPSNNVNNRPNFDAYANWSGTSAMSGVIANTGASTTWRKAISAKTRLEIGGSASVSSVQLSSEARAANPTARNSDFASQSIGLNFGLTRKQSKGPLQAKLSLGKQWYGGDPLAHSVRFSLSKALTFSPTTVTRVSGNITRLDRLDNPLGSYDGIDAGLTWSRKLSSGARLTLRGQVETISSASHLVDRTGQSLDVYYTLGQPVLGAQVTLSAQYHGKSYRQTNPSFAVKRADDELSLGVSLFLPEWQINGFAPVIDVKTRRNASNILPFNTQELKLSLGLKSAF